MTGGVIAMSVWAYYYKRSYTPLQWGILETSRRTKRRYEKGETEPETPYIQLEIPFSKIPKAYRAFGPWGAYKKKESFTAVQLPSLVAGVEKRRPNYLTPLSVVEQGKKEAEEREKRRRIKNNL